MEENLRCFKGDKARTIDHTINREMWIRKAISIHSMDNLNYLTLFYHLSEFCLRGGI